MSKILKYLKNLLISIDQFFNALLGGDPDETLSSRFGKCNSKICLFICMILHKLDKEHCKKSMEIDEGKDEVWRLD